MYECADILLPSLTQIINDSLKTGVAPSDFKTAIVKPLPENPGLDPNHPKPKDYIKPTIHDQTCGEKPSFINDQTI